MPRPWVTQAIAVGLLATALIGCTRRSDTPARDETPAKSPVPNERFVERLTLAERDSGRVTDVDLGQTVIIRLSSNRSTGYRWTLAPNCRSRNVAASCDGPHPPAARSACDGSRSTSTRSRRTSTT
jgi:hypothetical protein